MKRTLVIGDIHGGLKALKQVLKRAEVTTNDTLIFLGDYVDGWSESPQVLDFLMELRKTHNCILLRGNHDELLQRYLETNSYNELWKIHGGGATIDAYAKLSEEKKQEHIAFLKTLENYYLDKQNRLFVHAGFTNLKGVLHEYFPKSFYWDRTLWEMALSFDDRIPKDSHFYPARFLLYKEVFIGHTPVTRICEEVPIQKANIWNVDTGAAFRGPITVLNIDTKEFWQSDNVADLYSDEIGRN
ncbi:metallophosphoesterase family protein [Flavobacterium tegetincola]|uniref:metallophosphoesterase family protein n=1 Tax=Flavobacterium tegetincola TaxID=150172 RepID=UPI000422674E|nr:metallophosphoesterase family protein [Flavobacterium tegetincola]